ncbi:MAG: hypothetical protein ACI84C_000643 [Flavobacteriales bacterium]|jgi:hypothetical protein
MKRYLLVAGAIAPCVFFSAFSTAPMSVNLSDAIDSADYQVELTSLGNSSSECVSLVFNNQSNKDVLLHIDPGIRLVSGNSEEQDILLTHPMDVLVKSGSTGESSLTGFCCQSSNATPTEGSMFSVSDNTSNELANVGKYLAENDFEPSMSQAAIWSISDDHSLAGIYATEEDARLREFCADLRGEEAPWYSIEYGDILDTPFQNEPQVLSGKMHYEVDSNGLGDLKAYKPDGTLLVSFFEGREMTPAHYTQTFKFTAYGMEHGDYTFCVYVDGQVKEKQIITI